MESKNKKELMDLIKKEIDYQHEMISNNFNQIDNKILQLILINFGILGLFTSFIFPTFRNLYGILVYLMILALFFASLIILLMGFYPKKISSLHPLNLLNEYNLLEDSELNRALRDISTSKANSYVVIDKLTKDKTRSLNLAITLIVCGLFLLVFYSLIKFYTGSF